MQLNGGYRWHELFYSGFSSYYSVLAEAAVEEALLRLVVLLVVQGPLVAFYNFILKAFDSTDVDGDEVKNIYDDYPFDATKH